MKGGAENRKKTIIAGALGAAALVSLIRIYSVFFGGPDAPPPTPPSSVTQAARPAGTTNTSGPSTTARNPGNGPNGPANLPGGAAPGVSATLLAQGSSSLDPTLDQLAMLRTENLVYTGTGRNIFSATYTPPVVVKKFVAPVVPSPRVLPPPVPTGPPAPPPPPPIDLKFFGTETFPNGKRLAFLKNGDDVYLANQGDIVVRKYKIIEISAGSVRVTDLSNNNTQTLPLQQ